MGVGDRLGEPGRGATVERVETHPEYRRYWLRLDNGALLPAELTTATPGHEGLCAAGGVALYPRADLAQGALPEGHGAVVAALCPALEAAPPDLRARGATGDTPVAGAAGATRVSAVSGVVALLGLALVALLVGPVRRAWAALGWGERAEGVAVLAVAVAARVLGAPTGIFNGGGAAYEKIRFAWGTLDHAPYGQGYSALYGPVLERWGRDPEHLFLLGRGVSSLAPLLLWALVRLATPGPLGRPAALTAGLGLALLPVAVGLASSEAMHLPVVTLALLACAAAAGAARGGGWAAAAVAALAGGLAGHVRPEAIPLGALVLLWLWAPRARGGGAARGLAGLALLGLAGWAALGLDPGQDVLRAQRGVGAWLGALVPRWGAPRAEAGFSVFLHGGFTPVGLWPLAVLGLWFAPAGWRWRLTAAWAVAEAPFLFKVFPLADAWRLQLGAQPFWLALCGFGVAGAARAVDARRGGVRAEGPRWVTWAPWAVGAGLAARLVVVPADPDWAHHREFDALRALARGLGPDTTVWVAEEHPRVEAFAEVMGTVGPARWRPLSQRAPGPSTGDERLWLGLGCLTNDAPCTRARQRCSLGPGETSRILPPADLDLPLPVEGVDVSLYRLEACSP